MLPLFKSHYSIGKSILTLNPPGASKEEGSDSIFDILIENNLKKLVLVEDAPTGFLQARKICFEEGVHLIFGLRLKLKCFEEDDSPTSNHKVIIFAKNDEGCKKLNLSKSRGDTKRLIKSKGIKINDEIFNSQDLSLKAYSKLSEIKISVGKKNFGILRIKK